MRLERVHDHASAGGHHRNDTAHTEHALAVARVVGQGELWTEARLSGTEGDRNGLRAGAVNRVGGELLADSSDRAATLRQRDRRWGKDATVIGCRLVGFFWFRLPVEHPRLVGPCALYRRRGLV